VASYVPQGPEDATPDPEEDRIRNRLLLAGRLIGILRSQGVEVDRYVRELRSIERSFQDGDRVGAATAVDRLLGVLDAFGSPGVDLLPSRTR
jgi:hypothetical protein